MDENNIYEEVILEDESIFDNDTQDVENPNNDIDDLKNPDADEDEANDEIQCNNKGKKSVWPIILACFFTALVIAGLFGIIFKFFKAPTKIIYKNPDSTTNASSLATDSLNLSKVYEKYSPSTVYVSSTGIVGGFFSQKVSLGSATGVVISEDGYILTSASVITSGADITVTLNDSQNIKANLIGYDQRIDIALIKIEAEGLVPIVLGDSETVNIGDYIVSISTPLAPTVINTLDYGIISGINKNVSLQKGIFLNIFQTSFSPKNVTPGSAIFNSEGEVLGLVSNISSSADIAFAIPINDIKPFLSSQLNIKSDETKESDTPMLGITATEENYGIIVETVSENYPASKAGVKVGDVIIRVDNSPITTVDEVNKIRESHSRGDTMILTIFRDGETIDLNVVLE